jgi:CheY-like chemotaxis protein/tetratricopeptide (TPR) repeat protein
LAKQVLIIEDDDAVAKAVAEVCAGLGEVEVALAKTGSAGVDKFGQQAFDLVMLDILLPGNLDGYKVAEALRDKPGGAEVPIVVMSGFVKDPKVQKELQARFALKALLLKPLKPDDVRLAVAGALGLARPLSNPTPVAPLAAEAAAPKAESFVADLRELTVPELFGELFRRKAEGALDLTRGQTKKRFYLQRGWFRYGTSNVRAETLSGILPSRGVPEARVAEAMARAKSEGIAVTDALVELRVITERDVPALLANQTEEVAITALGWPDGKASFKAQVVDSGPEGRANPVMCVLKGLKRTGTAEQSRAALEPQRNAVLERTPELERELFAVRGLFAGETMTAAINGKLKVGELLGRAKDIDAQLLHALVACGLARVKGAAPMHLGAARPTTEPGTPAFVPGGGARPQTSSLRKQHSPIEEQARQQVFGEQRRLAAAADHYQVLGVPRGADAATIKTAYFKLARAFHADSFAGMDLGDAAPALEEVFKRVTEANRVLSHEEERTTYNLILENKAKGLPTSVEQVMQAEATFQRAESARKAGRLKDAEKLYREAVAQNAGEANFLLSLATAVHQMYGKASDAEVLDLLDKCLKIKQDSLPAMLLRGQLLLNGGEFKPALEIGRKILGIQADYPGAMELIKQAKAGVAGGPGAPGSEKGGLLGKLFGGKGK